MRADGRTFLTAAGGTFLAVMAAAAGCAALAGCSSAADAPDGTSHYVLSFTARAGDAVTGSASFLYADGRIAAAGSYSGRLSAQGKITLTLGDGTILSGRYAAGRLNLAGCAAALPLVTGTGTGGCTFTYHGHVP